MVMKRVTDWSPEDAQRLRRFRKSLRLTQAAMGARLGLGQSTISKLESGKQLSTVIVAAVRIYLEYGNRGAA